METASDIHRAMVEAAISRDFDRLRSLYADDYVYTDADGGERPGPDAAVEVVRMFTTAFPDYSASMVGQYQPSGDVSIIEYRARGTHRAELDGIPATDMPVEYPGCNVVEVRDGKIHREREYYDNLCILRQLGVLADD